MARKWRDIRLDTVTRLLGELFGENEQHKEVARQMLESWSSNQSCVTGVLRALRYYQERGWAPTTDEEFQQRLAEQEAARRLTEEDP